MTPGLHLAKGLELPLTAVTQTFAFMGKRGAGKTYGAGKLVEEMLKRDGQVVVIDPVGNWWGLRLAADGKAPGFAIPVVGGSHGDLALAPEAGALVADLVVDTGSSIVLDVSHFRKGERQRFVTDFAEQLFHRKKSARTPVHVVFEEAHLFVPQRTHSGQERMLGAMEDLVKLGRNYGIGASLLDQRPQSVNKDVLNQTECLLAFQLIGSQERKAIDLWAEDKGIGKGATRRLSELDVGQALVWSPTWLRFFDVVKIGKKRTFDGSATPEVGAASPAEKLAAIDLAALERAMSKVATETKASDPKALKKRIAELEREVRAKKPAIAAAPALPPIVDLSEVRAALDAAAAAIQQASRHLVEAAKRQAAGRSAAERRGVRPPPATRNERANGHASPELAADVGKGPGAMLAALASFHPTPLTKSQLATLAGYSPRSSTTRNYVSALRVAGHLRMPTPSTFGLTASGLAAAGPAPRPATTEELLELWCPRVTSGPAKILRLLVETYPAGLSKEDIERATGYSATSSTMRNYLSKLRANGLMASDERGYRASDTLFPEVVG
jgi:uncharacterized protein